MARPPAARSAAARQVVAGLAKVGLYLKTEAWREAQPRGLSPTQAEILALLQRRFPGGARLSDLAEGMALSPATLSVAVGTLVEKGLVRRGKSDDDGRALRLTLTPRGRREAGWAAAWPEALMGAVDELSGEERAVLLRSLMKMVRGLQEQRLVPVARLCVGCRFFRPGVHDDARAPHHCDFVDQPFGESELRLDCDDHEPATPEASERAWAAFTGKGTAGPPQRA